MDTGSHYPWRRIVPIAMGVVILALSAAVFRWNFYERPTHRLQNEYELLPLAEVMTPTNWRKETTDSLNYWGGPRGDLSREYSSPLTEKNFVQALLKKLPERGYTITSSKSDLAEGDYYFRSPSGNNLTFSFGTKQPLVVLVNVALPAE